MSLPTVYVETYGCQMNVADTEMVLRLLEQGGYARTLDPADADVILINTCAVRERAVERVRGRASMLAQYKSHDKRVVLGITGCMAEHLRGELREQAPYVDLVVGPDSYRRLLDHIERARAGEFVQDTGLDPFETYEGLDPTRTITRGTSGLTGGVTGNVPIQRGCDRFCTFCVVPFTRGRERGTPPDEVVRQVRVLAENGFREVQLLGQTVNSYRFGDVSFADLLRRVAEVDGIDRIRFTSPYPLDFSADVIAAMVELPKVCKHVHLPLQSASDSVLERMRRGYSFTEYMTLVKALRAAMPDGAITTDLLVGFCGETDAEFEQTFRAVTDIRFDNAFTFAYSERKGTLAARKIADDVPAEVKQRRLARVIEEQRRITAEIYAAQVGRHERVLCESPARRTPTQLLGRTETYRPVIVTPGQGVAVGDLLDVLIDRAGPGTLYGVPLAGVSRRE
jgi:tRNA-2-methylthio-N6-dimethylallyladenosine synthase